MIGLVDGVFLVRQMLEAHLQGLIFAKTVICLSIERLAVQFPQRPRNTQTSKLRSAMARPKMAPAEMGQMSGRCHQGYSASFRHRVLPAAWGQARCLPCGPDSARPKSISRTCSRTDGKRHIYMPPERVPWGYFVLWGSFLPQNTRPCSLTGSLRFPTRAKPV